MCFGGLAEAFVGEFAIGRAVVPVCGWIEGVWMRAVVVGVFFVRSGWAAMRAGRTTMRMTRRTAMGRPTMRMTMRMTTMGRAAVRTRRTAMGRPAMSMMRMLRTRNTR